ncbi:MAG: large conductance mechanosensitive channel protein MscL [Planctomycetota bacterium]|jgi:large conductance mechanosensitive channel
MLKEFKEFAMRGNVLDMAIGIVIGAAFGTVVKSFVSDLLMPPIGLMTQGMDFNDAFIVLKEGRVPGPFETLESARDAGAVTLNAGAFVGNVVSFVIVAFAAFLLVKAVNAARRREEGAPEGPAMKPCPFCCSSIARAATRCPHCTSEQTAA